MLIDYLKPSPGHLACVLAVALLSYIVYQRWISPLAGIPGPWTASLSKYWIVKHTIEGRLHRDLVDLHTRHGSIVRIAPNEVSVSDLDAIRKIYGAGSKFHKSNWYKVLQGGRQFDLFAEPNETVHGQQRRLVSRAYAMDGLKDLEPYVDSTIRHFSKRLMEFENQNIDMGKMLQLFAFDVIGEITFARRFGFMDALEDDGIFDQIQRSVRSGVWLAHVPYILRLHNWFMPIIGNHLAINDRNGTIRDYTVREVDGRFDRGSDRPDILGKLISINKERPVEMSKNNIVSVAGSNIGAGSDTTAISLRAILFFLLRNPDKLKALLGEIDSMVREENIIDVFSFAQASKMPYLQAVMYEAMRLYPAIGATLPRITPHGGLVIGERFIPAGTIVGTSAWVVHQNEDIYGQDVKAFRPERWINKESEDMKRFFFTFGGGSRTCIGKNISWMEISKLVPTLLYHFNLAFTDPDVSLDEHCSFFVMQTGLNLVPRQRNSLLWG